MSLHSHENGRWKGPFFIFSIFIQFAWPRFGCFEIFLRYSVTRRRFVRILVWLWMHTVVFHPSWAAKRTSLFERLRLISLTKRLHCQDGYMLRCMLDSPREFLRDHHAQERVGAFRPWRGKGLFLAQGGCLGSDDNHVKSCKNVYIIYIFRIVFNIYKIGF